VARATNFIAALEERRANNDAAWNHFAFGIPQYR